MIKTKESMMKALVTRNTSGCDSKLLVQYKVL